MLFPSSRKKLIIVSRRTPKPGAVLLGAGGPGDRALRVATDLITQFDPAVPDHAPVVRAPGLIATGIAPALGRRPAGQPEPQGV